MLKLITRKKTNTKTSNKGWAHDFWVENYFILLLVVEVVVASRGIVIEGLDPPGAARVVLQAAGVAGPVKSKNGTKSISTLVFPMFLCF